MVPYDPKNWWRVFFSLKGTILAGVWIRAVGVGLLAVLFTLMYQDKILLPPDPAKVKDPELAAKPEYFKICYYPEVPTLVHTVIGFVLGLLIVFRTNSSYDRYWEGRKLWGSIVNNARSLIRGASAYAGPADDLARLVAGYSVALKHHLRGEKDFNDLKGILSDEDFRHIKEFANPPMILAASMSAWLQSRRAQGRLDSNMIRLLEGYVANIIDSQGGCERILKTPIPFVYAVHIKHLLFVYLATLPLALVPSMGWFSVPTAIVLAVGLLGIEEAGLEIEDPFGTDPNDLPLDDLCSVVERDAKAHIAAFKPTATS